MKVMSDSAAIVVLPMQLDDPHLCPGNRLMCGATIRQLRLTDRVMTSFAERNKPRSSAEL
jgi:hypothetical protein